MAEITVLLAKLDLYDLESLDFDIAYEVALSQIQSNDADTGTRRIPARWPCFGTAFSSALVRSTPPFHILTEKPSAFGFQNSQHFLPREALLGGVLELGHIGKAEQKGFWEPGPAESE
jgi:hypothetical protein